MSKPDHLDELEREVERARAKLDDDLAVLSSPQTYSSFGDALKAEASTAKDALVQRAKESASSTLSKVVRDLKGRAAANPGAALAIGAGIAWQLIRRPPIATALVGAGLFSLLRTAPDFEKEREIRQTVGSVTDKARDWSVAAQRTGAEMKEQAESLAGQASSMMDDAKTMATRAAETVGTQASAALGQVSSSLHDALDDVEVRDKALLGAAALAVAAAVGISVNRRLVDQS